MRRGWLSVAGMLLALASCATEAGNEDSRPTAKERGVRIVALADVMISRTPLGDVGLGALGVGQRATATCFVPKASTNIGAKGSAVKVILDDGSGYVPVLIVDPETGEQVPYLEQNVNSLRRRLPEC